MSALSAQVAVSHILSHRACLISRLSAGNETIRFRRNSLGLGWFGGHVGGS